MEDWIELEVLEEFYYDGPLVTVTVGKYTDGSSPRLLIKMYHQDEDIDGHELFSPSLEQVQKWTARLQWHTEDQKEIK